MGEGPKGVWNHPFIPFIEMDDSMDMIGCLVALWLATRAPLNM